MLRHAAYGWSQSGLERDTLYANLHGKKFVDISGVSGLDSITDGRGPVYGDWDNDGDLDVFLPTIQGDSQLMFRNDVGQDNHWIRVTLAGRKSGRDAFGSVVRVKFSGGVQAKIKSGGEGFMSQHDPRLLFGIGEDTAAEWIDVQWPDGSRQRFPNVPMNTSIRVTEGADTYETLTEKRFQLAEPPPKFSQAATKKAKSAPQRLPDMTVSAAGKRVPLSALVSRSPSTVIAVWATWCRACVSELATLTDMQPELRRRGIAVIALNVDEKPDPAAIEKFVKDYDITLPVAVADASAIGALYGGSKDRPVPLSLLVGEDGVIHERIAGYSGRGGLMKMLAPATRE